jgi:hypothetical protein
MHGIHESGLAFQNAVKKAMESRCSMIKSKVIPATWLTRELYTRVQCKEDDVPEEFGGTVAKEFVILTITPITLDTSAPTKQRPNSRRVYLRPGTARSSMMKRLQTRP